MKMFSAKCFCDIVAVDYVPNYNCTCLKLSTALKDCFLVKVQPSSQLEICKSEQNSYFYCKECVPAKEDRFYGSYFEEVVFIFKGFKHNKIINCNKCFKILFE